MLLNMVLITIKQTNKQTNYPVINTSTDYKKSDHVQYSESNTILLCMHTVRHLYTESIQQYQQEAARQVIGGKLMHLRVSPWTLRWYHHESLRYSLSTEERYNLKDH
jgi:hypothetical protein